MFLSSWSMHTEARFGIEELSNRQGQHALFTGEDDTWEAWLSVDASGFSSIVNLGHNGIKLRRGYVPSESKKPTQLLETGFGGCGLFINTKHMSCLVAPWKEVNFTAFMNCRS